MPDKKSAVFGIYTTRHQAEQGVGRLREGGFSTEDISILLKDSLGSEDFAHEKGTEVAPDSTAAGVKTGGAIGGTLGLLAGISALAIPGVGPLIAAGPIMAALAGLGVGGAFGGAVGGVIAGLVGVGVPEYDAKRYESRLMDGAVLLSVHCDTPDEIARAKGLLKQSGALDISSPGEARADPPAISMAAASTVSTAQQR